MRRPQKRVSLSYRPGKITLCSLTDCRQSRLQLYEVTRLRPRLRNVCLLLFVFRFVSRCSEISEAVCTVYMMLIYISFTWWWYESATLKVNVKVWTPATAPLTWVRLVTSRALQSWKWQLNGMSQWCRSALCGHPLPALTDNWTHGAASTSRHLAFDLFFTFHWVLTVWISSILFRSSYKMLGIGFKVCELFTWPTVGNWDSQWYWWQSVILVDRCAQWLTMILSFVDWLLCCVNWFWHFASYCCKKKYFVLLCSSSSYYSNAIRNSSNFCCW